jgi:tetratricopeptide (TPR) repeat protein
MKIIILFILAIVFNSTVFAQLTEEQIKAYNSLSPAEKKKVDDQVNAAIKKHDNNMLAIARDAQRDNVLKMKPLSSDSISAILKKVNRERQFNLMSDMMVYDNVGGNDNEKLGKFESADTFYLGANKAITKKELLDASTLTVFYFYKNRYDYARSLYKRKKYQQSLDIYLEAAEYYKPDSSHYYAAKSGIELLKQGVVVNKSSILENLNKAITLDTRNDLFIREKGFFYLSQIKDTTLAIADFTKSTQLNPKDHVSYQSLSLIQFNRSNIKEAVNYISKSIEIDKNNEIYFYQRGLYHQFLEEYQLAISDFNSAIILNSFDPKFYIYRAKCHLNLKNYPDAYDDFGFATMLYPNDAASKEQMQKLDPLLKQAYEKEGFTMATGFKFFMDRADKQSKEDQVFQYGRAIMNYYKCIQLEPKNPIPYNKAGNLFMIFKMDGPAEQFLRYAASADGKNPEYFVNLGQCYAIKNNYKAATGCLDTAALLGSTNSVGYTLNGSIKGFKIKDYEGSIKSYNKGIALDPSRYESRYGRALVYMDGLHNYKAALEDLELIVKKEPQNEDYLFALKECREKLKK